MSAHDSHQTIDLPPITQTSSSNRAVRYSNTAFRGKISVVLTELRWVHKTNVLTQLSNLVSTILIKSGIISYFCTAKICWHPFQNIKSPLFEYKILTQHMNINFKPALDVKIEKFKI